jgi:hypothetical protein
VADDQKVHFDRRYGFFATAVRPPELPPALELPLDEPALPDAPAELDAEDPGVAVVLPPPCVYPCPFTARPCDGATTPVGCGPCTTTIGWLPGYQP